MNRFFRSLLCLLSAALAVTAIASGCGAAPEEEGTQATSSVQTMPTTTAAPVESTSDEPSAPASPDSANADEGSITYNELEIKKNLNEIEKNLDALIENCRFNGAVFAKVGNNFDYIKAKGFANQGAHLDNSIYRNNYVGSVTTMFTATAVLKLSEEGKLSLDDKLDKYFPGCEYGGDVTVRQLLTMTSGIPGYLTRAEGHGGMTLVQDLRGKINGGNAYGENKATILSWILSQKRRETEKGSDAFAYSDSDYYLLGEIIAAASGSSYETYMIDHIFRPNDMNKTGFEEDESTARPYESSSLTRPLLCDAVGYSAAGVITNISDMLKFVDALTAGEIIGKGSLREMLTDNGSGYGCGVYVNGNAVSVFGQIDAYSTKLVFTPDRCRIFAATSNYSNADPNLLYRLFFNSMRKYRNK